MAGLYWPASEHLRKVPRARFLAEFLQDFSEIDVESTVDDQPKSPFIVGVNAEKYHRLPEIWVGEVRHCNQQLARERLNRPVHSVILSAGSEVFLVN